MISKANYEALEVCDGMCPLQMQHLHTSNYNKGARELRKDALFKKIYRLTFFELVLIWLE